MDFNLPYILLNIAVGGVIGFAIGLTGIGGGVLVMPSLIYILGIPALPAVGTGLLFAAISRIGAVRAHIRLGTVRQRSTLFFLAGSVPAVIVSSFFLNRLARRVDVNYLNAVLQRSIGAVLFAVAVVLLFSGIMTKRQEGKREENYYVPRREYPLRLKVGGIVFGIITGLIIGMTSIGGGVVIIPILLFFFNFRPVDTVGTSNAISFVLAFFGSFAYIAGANLIWPSAVLLALSAFPGVSWGSRLSVKLPARVLKNIILLIVIFASLSLLFKR